MKRFETSIGLQDEFPFGYLKGATVKESIDHHPEFVEANHLHEYVLQQDAIIYLRKVLERRAK